MKTAVSIPDDIFELAEALAHREKRSRSDVYARALSEYVARHAPDSVTEAMDRVLDTVSAPAERFISKSARRTLARSELVNISQGEVWWADLGEARGSNPGFRRPVVVIQGDSLNRSRISTAVCVPLTSNVKWASAPGNAFLSDTATRNSPLRCIIDEQMTTSPPNGRPFDGLGTRCNLDLTS
jgi:mRNA interferase MazF